MKLFCSYAYTGENLATVTKRMNLVVESLRRAGHEVYCPLFDERIAPLQEANDITSIFAHAFEGIRRQEAVVVIISSERRSEGQLMEIGAALSGGKSVYLVQNQAAAGKSYLPKLATKTVVWQTDNDLAAQLATLID